MKAIYLDETVPDFPTENSWVVFLVFLNSLLDLWSGDSWFAASYDSGPYATSLLISIEYFGDTSMRYPKLTTYNAGTNSGRSHLHDLVANVIGKWTAIDEDTPELVDASLP